MVLATPLPKDENQVDSVIRNQTGSMVGGLSLNDNCCYIRGVNNVAIFSVIHMLQNDYVYNLNVAVRTSM